MRKFFIVFASFNITFFLILFSALLHDLMIGNHMSIEEIWMFLGGFLGLCLIATIFFTPVLLVISTLQLLVKEHIKLKYFISFLLMEIHGFLIFIVWFNGGIFNRGIGNVIGYFVISIIVTIIYLYVFYFIDNKKYINIFNFLVNKYRHWRKQL